MQFSEKVDFSYNPLADPKFSFYDHTLVEAVKTGDEATHRFFRLLSLCHTVMSEEKQEGKGGPGGAPPACLVLLCLSLLCRKGWRSSLGLA